MKIAEIQDQLQRLGLAGWLLYDFQGSNPIARRLLSLQGNLLTRRWFYWIPRQGTPTLLCHQIEQHGFSSVLGKKHVFRSWKEMERGLQEMLAGDESIAMEYSPQCSIPYVSRVDAGTLELVNRLGKKVVSSANLVQYFEARWSPEQFEMHQEASRLLMQILFESFEEVRHASKRSVPMSEFMLQQAMLKKYQERGLISFSPPIVAVNQNTGNPHYEPHKDSSSLIKQGDLLLIDLWAKVQKPHSVYADYTWVAYLGGTIPEKYLKIWEVVKSARDAALAFIQEKYGKGREVQGWEVDLAARNLITREGFGEFFIHRTGHSIGEEDHGNGANMDSLETKDERSLIPHTCFSIEPGIYLQEFGIRSEVNVYLKEADIVITGDLIQNEIVKMP